MLISLLLYYLYYIVMFIKEITYQDRRDFDCIYKCEHCWYEEEGEGYDDDNFHEKGVPTFKCKECGKSAGEEYTPRQTKYEDWQIL